MVGLVGQRQAQHDEVTAREQVRKLRAPSRERDALALGLDGVEVRIVGEHRHVEGGAALAREITTDEAKAEKQDGPAGNFVREAGPVAPHELAAFEEALLAVQEAVREADAL